MKFIYFTSVLLVLFLIKSLIIHPEFSDAIIVGFLSIANLLTIYLDYNKKEDPMPHILKRMAEIETLASTIRQVDSKFDEKFKLIEAKLIGVTLKGGPQQEVVLPKFKF